MMRDNTITDPFPAEYHLIMAPKPNDWRLAALGLADEHEDDAAIVAITRDGATIASAVLAKSRPAGHPPSPYDAGSWIIRHNADSREARIVLLQRVKFITREDVRVYAHASDESAAEALASAGYRVRGVASRGWRVWTADA